MLKLHPGIGAPRLWRALLCAGLLALAASALGMAQETGPSATFGDDRGRLDQVVVLAPGLVPVPEGAAWVWLRSIEAPLVRSLGPLTPDATGTPSLWWTIPTTENLLGAYSEVLVTAEPDNAVPASPGRVVLRGQVDAGALPHLRRLLAMWPESRYGEGSLQGLRLLAQQVQAHASLLGEAAGAEDLPAVRRKAEHLANLLGGQSAAGYGDLDGDGLAEDPGDGQGLLPYGAAALEQVVNVHVHALDDSLATRALAVEAPLLGLTQQAGALRDVALELAATEDLGRAQELVALIQESVAQLEFGTAPDGPAAHPGLPAIYAQAVDLARVQLRGGS